MEFNLVKQFFENFAQWFELFHICFVSDSGTNAVFVFTFTA